MPAPTTTLHSFTCASASSASKPRTSVGESATETTNEALDRTEAANSVCVPARVASTTTLASVGIELPLAARTLGPRLATAVSATPAPSSTRVISQPGELRATWRAIRVPVAPAPTMARRSTYSSSFPESSRHPPLRGGTPPDPRRRRALATPAAMPTAAIAPRINRKICIPELYRPLPSRVSLIVESVESDARISRVRLHRFIRWVGDVL